MAYPPAALPEVLPGKDRAYGAGLFVDLIPETSWFRNVRAAVAPEADGPSTAQEAIE